MKILLTGGTGGLGRELVRAAETAGHTVRVGSRAAAPANLPAGREWARMDVASGQGVREALAAANVVVHAASDPRRHAAVDVRGTRHLVEPRERSAWGTSSTCPSWASTRCRSPTIGPSCRPSASSRKAGCRTPSSAPRSSTR